MSELLTVNEAAARLQRSYQNTKDLLLRNRLHGVVIGSRWFVVRSSLDALLAEREQKRNGNGVPA